LVFVLANGDQSLAAEPGFHSDAPLSGCVWVMPMGRFFDHCAELAEQQSKNDFALRFSP